MILSCSKDDSDAKFDIQPFVRFNFLVNSNNEPLVYPQVNSGLIPKNNYTNKSVKTLKIPVTLSSSKLKNSVTINYSITSSGNSNSFTINPLNKVTFQDTKLTDTIYLSFNERWSSNQTITLKLEDASDTSINIGNLNDSNTNDVFTISLEDINTTYTLPSNRVEIKGEQGETLMFNVNFPNGFILSEINTDAIFEFLNGFDYTLEIEKIADDKSFITYKLTLNEDIQNDNVYYQTIINLKDSDTYSTTGNTVLQIVKPIVTPRDNSVNTAANFYNLSDSFNRTYGETWNDFNKDGICQWSSFNTFTYPVVVSADSPNAILYDNKGTVDTSDDVYHDAFKIGFKTPNAITTTTNSFNLKRWFSNESTSGINSPGFDINPALEFFPENGNSTTKGTVLVIPQYITISGTNGNSYSIAISGEGTYEEYSSGFFELKFQLKATNDLLFGGTVTAEYRLYNNNSYPDPEDLTTTNCVTEYEL
jgi:hypothetical protein